MLVSKRYHKPLSDEEDEKEMEKFNLKGDFAEFLASIFEVIMDLNSTGTMMAKE